VLAKLWRNMSTLLLSIILATMVWFVAVREQNPPIEADYGHQIPLEVEGLPEGMVIYGEVPDRVALRLLAPQLSWDGLSPSKFRAWIDLEELAPGLHDLPVQVEVSDRSVSVVEKRPSTINVRLESLVEVELPINIDVMDSAPTGYVARTPITNPITATITGPETVVGQTDRVLAEVYLRGAKETVERTADLEARNSNGDTLTGITIDPQQIDVTIPIEQRFGYRDVAVRAPISGEVAPGYWINNITVDPSTVTVVGGPAALSNLPGYVETFPIDVSDATSDITERVAFNLPEGVSVVGPGTSSTASGSGVQVSIAIAAVEGGQTVERSVTLQGLSENLQAVARPEQVDVILSGPLPRLQALTLEDVKVIVDLFDLGTGVHKVKPNVVVPETLRVESVLPDTVEVEIELKPSSPIPTSQTPAPTATMSPTPVSIPGLGR
jgi:YbbR domain-containing protein